MPEGSRNSYLSQFAGRVFLYDVLIARSFPYKAASGMLWDAAQQAGLEDEEIHRTLESALKYARAQIRKKKRPKDATPLKLKSFADIQSRPIPEGGSRR